MIIRIDELKNKEVISIADGIRIGYIGDVEVDSKSAKLNSIVVYGRQRFFGFFGRDDDSVIPWESISVIGEDTVLVNFAPPHRKRKTGSFLANFFEFK